MSLAIAILADANLDRVQQLAEMLAVQDVNICIHVDAGTDISEFRTLRSTLRRKNNIIFTNRAVCDWGQFSLVDAELRMCTDILRAWPDTTHVQLISGDSLPIRPMNELKTLLSDNKNVDFIESVLVQDDNWITGGLGVERFTLHFPFSWKTQRRRFDAFVSIQRRMKIARKIPEGLQPYIGSQWWCLTRKTLDAILSDPNKLDYDRYFQKCWVPDESYFQTLARKHARKIQSRSLLFSQFDHQGKPTTFYDDHIHQIGGLDEFFIRKVWSGANDLYAACTTFGLSRKSNLELNKQISAANDRRKIGRAGLRMQGRAPNNWQEQQPVTAAPYAVLSGFDVVFTNFDDWFAKKTLPRPYGRLFSETAAHFQDGDEIGPGGLSANPKIRNTAPIEFLGNLIWQTRDEKIAFHIGVDDCKKTMKYMSQDPNVRVYHIQYGWILDLMAEKIKNYDLLRSRAVNMAERERVFLEQIQGASAKCSANICTLGEIFQKPATILTNILSEYDTGQPSFPIEIPTLVAADPAIHFANKLKDIGINIDMKLVELHTSNTQATTRNIQNR